MTFRMTVLAVVLALLPPASAGPQDSPSHFSFKKAWEYRSGDALAVPPAVEGGRVFLALSGGRVVCLDRLTGSLLWSSDPGGSITQEIAVAEKVAYVATRKEPDATGSLRALDKETGLTLWWKEYREHLTGPIHVEQGRLFAGTSAGALCAFAADSGETIWKAPTQDVVRGRVLVKGSAVFFGSDDGALRGVEADSGREFWRFQSGARIRGKPVSDGETIYFGSGDGYFYAVDLKTAKAKWKSRAGAAIEASPALVEDKLIVASFDNFVYGLSRLSGDRIWKTRLGDRITAQPIVEGRSMIVAPLRGDQLVVLSISDGRRIGRYDLDEGDEIVAAPVFYDGTLFIATDKGLVVAATKRAEP